MSDPRTLNEAFENNLNPFRITKFHKMICECGHSVSFHFFTGLCKGYMTSYGNGCGCRNIELEKNKYNG